jgi:expansin (peptidoglycan-binding protein)
MPTNTKPTLDASNNVVGGSFLFSAPQTLTLTGSAGAATLSAAITKDLVRITSTQPAMIRFTVSTAVTAGTGHYLTANVPHILPKGDGNTKVSILGATTTAGTLYLSELG